MLKLIKALYKKSGLKSLIDKFFRKKVESIPQAEVAVRDTQLMSSAKKVYNRIF